MSSLSLAGLHSCPADSVELDPPTVLLYWGSSQRKHSLLPGTEQWYWWKLICWIPITISQTSINILRAKGQIFSPLWCPFLQFFADVKGAQDKKMKMQENMKKKYSCDRSTTATRLEDLLQDAVVSQDSSQQYTWMYMNLTMPDYLLRKCRWNNKVVKQHFLAVMLF